MYSRHSLGDFYPVKSTMHKINPIIKFINFLIVIVLVIGSTSLEIHLFLISLVVVMMLISNVPLRFYFNTLYSFRYMWLILLFVLSHLGFSLELCVVYLIKIISVLQYLNIIIYTTSTSELYYGFEKILGTFNFLNFNIGKISIAIVNAIKFFPLLMMTENRILKTQASRGIDYYHSDIIGKLYAIKNSLNNTFRVYKYKQKQISNMTNLRMFTTRRKRTNLRVNYVGFYDVIFLLFHLALLTSYIFERGILDEILIKLHL